jgi:hypothetical protein
MAKSLREVIRKPISHKTVYRFIDRKHTDFRAYVITSVALLDAGLERLLKSRMRHTTSSEDAGLFGTFGLLSGVAAKIRIACTF